MTSFVIRPTLIVSVPVRPDAVDATIAAIAVAIGASSATTGIESVRPGFAFVTHVPSPFVEETDVVVTIPPGVDQVKALQTGKYSSIVVLISSEIAVTEHPPNVTIKDVARPAASRR